MINIYKGKKKKKQQLKEHFFPQSDLNCMLEGIPFQILHHDFS